MKKKIETSDDVQLLVRSFYKRVLKDELLGPYFSYVAAHHWESHLETIDTFWNNIIFYSGGYFGNPLEVHQRIHQFRHFEPQHFERWLKHFDETVDELFRGEKALLAKQRAHSIAVVMQIKILPQ